MKRRMPINKGSLVDSIASSSVWYSPFNYPNLNVFKNKNLLGFSFINFLKFEQLKREYQADEEEIVSTNEPLLIGILLFIKKILFFSLDIS